MNFQPHSDLNNPKRERERERERATEESNRHTSFGRRASSVHHSSSAVQALSTICRPSCKLHPPSLFFSSLILSLSLWPTKAESLTTCHWSTTHHPSLPSLLPLDRTTDLVTQTPNSIAFLTILPPPLPIFFSQAISLQLFHNWYSVWGRGPIFFFFFGLHSNPKPFWSGRCCPPSTPISLFPSISNSFFLLSTSILCICCE